jgi:hypothetical protein
MIGGQEGSHKANLQIVPTKLCTVCGHFILWRRRSAQTWDAVQYCSAVCRRNRHTHKQTTRQQSIRPSNTQIGIASAS